MRTASVADLLSENKQRGLSDVEPAHASEETSILSAEELKDAILQTLRAQGFEITDNHLVLPNCLTKDQLRDLHASAVQHRIERAKPGLRRYEKELLKYIASGDEVIPEAITPKLVEVLPGSKEELLFRYASLHWSIPVSSGYGRRIRFVVVDESNNKLIGILGLGDPVFGLAGRDRWIGWDCETRRRKLTHVLDAFVLGAVPPYSLLLCGKLVAMLATSNEVREAFKRKYGGRSSTISKRAFDGEIALLTTTSALGRSSLYNRITCSGSPVFISVGLTNGYGEFQFCNGLYKIIYEYARANCTPTAKHDSWGRGFRNKREVLLKLFQSLDLPRDLLRHQVQREIFVAPLAHNAREFLNGEQDHLDFYDRPVAKLFEYFRERWLLPRAQRDHRYLAFRASEYAVWDGKE